MASSPTKKVIDANRGKVAPFVTNQVSLHDHQPQKIDGKVYNFSLVQMPNLDCHVASMTIPLQVSVLASFFASLSNYYSFKIQAGHYSCKNLTLEMDLTNTLAAAVQLVPAPLLVNYVRITTRSWAILQTLYGKELWGYLAMTSNNVKMTGYQYITNTAPTTFQSAGSIADGASVTYNIPLSPSFLVQLDFFLGNLNNSGLTIEVYSGPSATTGQLCENHNQVPGNLTDALVIYSPSSPTIYNRGSQRHHSQCISAKTGCGVLLKCHSGCKVG